MSTTFRYETRTETSTGEIVGDGSGWSAEKPPALTEADAQEAWDAYGFEWLADDPEADPLYLVVVRRDLATGAEEITDQIILADLG